VAVARRKLSNAPKRIADEEDVALNVFKSLCDGVEEGRFEQLHDRDDLWKLLVVMTRHKSMNQMRHQTAQKRGGRNVSGHSIFDETNREGFDYFFSDDPTPDFLVEIEEEQERLLGMLTGKGHREIAELRLQGFSVDETAEKLGISPRSVKRKLASSSSKSLRDELAILRWLNGFEQVIGSCHCFEQNFGPGNEVSQCAGQPNS
jgi:DNA-directed RNA polymerase specialized sigma24 family protein